MTLYSYAGNNPVVFVDPSGLCGIHLNENAEPNLGPLGTDPSKAPEGFVWKGKPGTSPGDREGNYVNPGTDERLHPDLNHPDPIGPHWDYWPSKNGPKSRLDPNTGSPLGSGLTPAQASMLQQMIMLGTIGIIIILSPIGL